MRNCRGERKTFLNRSFLLYARVLRAFGKLLLHLLVEGKSSSSPPSPLSFQRTSAKRPNGINAARTFFKLCSDFNGVHKPRQSRALCARTRSAPVLLSLESVHPCMLLATIMTASCGHRRRGRGAASQRAAVPRLTASLRRQTTRVGRTRQKTGNRLTVPGLFYCSMLFKNSLP